MNCVIYESFSILSNDKLKIKFFPYRDLGEVELREVLWIIVK